MSDSEQTPLVDLNKFLDVQSKELDIRAKEIESRNLEIQKNAEIRKHEIDNSVEVQKTEFEKLKIFIAADEKSASRKFILTLSAIVLGIVLMVFSCYLLFIDHKYGITLFFSTLSFVAGVFSGIGLIKSSDREVPSE